MLKQYIKSPKPVAACIVLVWLLLFGIAFAEDLGLFGDTFENGDPQLEQVLSSDVIEDAQASDYARLVGSLPVVVPSLLVLHSLCASPRSYANIGESVVRMERGFKLYLLHSTYLI